MNNNLTDHCTTCMYSAWNQFKPSQLCTTQAVFSWLNFSVQRCGNLIRLYYDVHHGRVDPSARSVRFIVLVLLFCCTAGRTSGLDVEGNAPWRLVTKARTVNDRRTDRDGRKGYCLITRDVF